MDASRNQLVYVLWTRRTLGGLEGGLPVSELQQQVERTFEEHALPIAHALESLAATGCVARDGDGRWDLTEAGRRLGPPTKAAIHADGFDRWLLQVQASAAFARVCRLAHRTDFPQFGMTDQAQLDLLVNALEVGPGRAVLDAGCAIGTIAEHVAARTGAHVHGVDLAPAAIAMATARAERSGLPLTYAVANLDAFSPEPARYDAVMAIDTLYFVDDIAGTIGRLLSGLRAGGKLVAFFSATRGSSAPQSTLEPGSTMLARALDAHGLSYEVTDLTSSDRDFWTRYHQALRDAEATYAAEGNAGLWARSVEESGRNVAAHAEGRSARFLYVARQATRRDDAAGPRG